MMQRKFIHLDVDAFFASVEQIRNPRLAGRPVIVGSGCIASCSYEARALGLHAGMGLGDARRLCPKVVILAGNNSVYRSFAEKIWELCRGFCPNVDTFLDDAYLDLAGTERLYPDILSEASELKKFIRRETGLSVTMGIGPSRVTARMASRKSKPNGLLSVMPADVRAFLAAFKVEDLPGVGHRTREVLHNLNVTSVRELQRLPRQGLVALFGQLGAALYERSRGRDSMVVTKREIPGSISRETTFHKETTDPAEIRGMIHYLSERIGSTLRELGCGAKRIALRIRYGDYKGDEAADGFPEPVDDDSELSGAAFALLDRLYTRRVALRHVGVSVSNIRPMAQLSLFAEPAADRSHRLLEAMDAVRGKFGFSSITAGRSLDLLGKLKQDSHGYILRTSSLTK